MRCSAAVLRFIWPIALPLLALGHPMGNFSVNHYSRLHFERSGLNLLYVLDLAEIPTFQLLGSWHAGPLDQNLLDQKTREQAREWVTNLFLLEDGYKVPWTIQSIRAQTADGAGGMALLQIEIAAEAPLKPGRISYEDSNFPGRAGWKEIVVDHGPDVFLRGASQGSTDVSRELTVYPADPSVIPPQDLTATVEWSLKPLLLAPSDQPASVRMAMPAPRDANPLPVAPQVAAVVSPAPRGSSFSGQQPIAPGSVVRGDFLSTMLQRKNLGSRLLLLCILAAFGLGAMHAMSPGHGKTIVAAYLVGSRGTLKHAALLGMVVTFTHTFTVFLLGAGVLFFQQYVVPEKIIPILGVLSGLSIVAVGISLLYRRLLTQLAAGHEHFHGHVFHDHTPAHDHHHDDDHGSGLVHSHGGSTHSHMVEGEITLSGLVALGVSGGLVPCPSALILMLSAIALGRPALGLVLLTAFSAGLSMVLMGIGVLALYARKLLPDSQKASRHPAFHLIPVFSAVVVIVLGLAITATSAGWIQPLRFLS